MEAEATVKSFYATLNTSGPEAALAFLADEYSVEQPGGPSQNREQWLAMQKMWRTGILDLAIDYDVQKVEGELVDGVSKVTGTHTSDLNLELLGIGIVPATGKSIAVSVAVQHVVAGDRIVLSRAIPDDGDDSPSILAQLGIRSA